MSHLENKRRDVFVEKMLRTGYEEFTGKTYDALKENFRKIITKRHKDDLVRLTKRDYFSDEEFNRLYKMITTGSFNDLSHKLRRRQSLQLDNNTILTVILFDVESWCSNHFQIASELQSKNYSDKTQKGCRYDAVILINGLPLVIMELKQSDVHLNNAYKQIVRYKKSNGFDGIFGICQMFIISNFANTKYFANNKELDANFVFNFTNKENSPVEKLYYDKIPIDEDLSVIKNFLGRCFLAEILARYMIVNPNENNIILRPYQIYAVREIIERCKTKSNGYVFHTTGSGKTITSFKASKILTTNPDVDKVVLLVDRKDLDNQTKKEYEKLQANSYNSANNTSHLKALLLSDNKEKIVISTIQKMKRLLGQGDDETSGRLTAEEKKLVRSKRYAVIIDECHRSMSNDTVNTLNAYFLQENTSYIGFTGTPILIPEQKNFTEEQTKEKNILLTKNVFGEEIHKYAIANAVKDKNVLGFHIYSPSGIGGKEIVKEDNEQRIEQISEIVLNEYDKYTQYTRSREDGYNALFATKNKKMLMSYYETFKRLNKLYTETIEGYVPLKFTCIFSVIPDEEESNFDTDFMNEVVTDYKEMFGVNYLLNSSDGIEQFKHDVQDKIKAKELDLVFVVDMLLTGFDAKSLNTLFVDKPLKYHGLLQAYSRVNRVYNASKNHGNIVTFFDQSSEYEEAFELFSADKDYRSFIADKYEDVKNSALKAIRRAEEDVNDALGTTGELTGDKIRAFEERPDYKDVLPMIKDAINKYKNAREYPEFDVSEFDLYQRKEISDLERSYKTTITRIKNRVEIEDVSEDEKQAIYELQDMHFDFEKIDYEYFIKFIFSNSKDKPKVHKYIETFSLEKDVEEALKDYVDTNDFNDIEHEQALILLKEALSYHEEKCHESLIVRENIENKESYYGYVTIEKDSELRQSDISNIRKDLVPSTVKFSERSAKAKKIYFDIKDIVTRFSLERY